MSKYTQWWANQSYQGIKSYTRSRRATAVQQVVTNLFCKATVRRITDALAEATPLDHVADVGCGVGQWTRAFLEFSREVTAIDVNAEFLAEARRTVGDKAHRVRFIEANALDVDGFETAPLICFGACLMYFTDDQVHQLLDRVATGQQSGDLLYVRASVSEPRGQRFETDVGVYRRTAEYDALFEHYDYEPLLAIHSATLVIGELLSYALPLAPAALDSLIDPLVAAVRQRGDDTAFYNWLLRRR